MNNFSEMWSARFFDYMRELQRYMQYIFTGHLAIVLVFTIGAGGYAYSEWLKEVSVDFPAAILTALVISGALVYSPPVTLLKPADIVFFLPLETQLPHYLGKALKWSTFSQIPLPLVLYIVALPLLSATETATGAVLLWLAVFIIVLKWLFVETEFSVHYARAGAGVWTDRLVRFVIATVFIYLWLSPNLYLILIPAVVMGIYLAYWHKQKMQKPFPYEHFITLEQNRMMRFYRFANYFTDVPHLKGAISRRRWLGFTMQPPTFGRTKSQQFLVRRTFLRTDDSFWLWVRLTGISMFGAYFISIPIAIMVFVGALAFASSIQLIYALRSGDDFRMDMLFPEPPTARGSAIQKTVRGVQWIQALFVAIVSLFALGWSVTVVVLFLIVIIVSELTIRSAKEKE
ncbi:ABC transporter permease [Sporosarcina pasteurii]|uniref:Predicted ABC-type exoprotein transport system, permease component n=1 Tax=Sporosarcina pasteurii TaxID=1474 RepID=A0A380C9R6_SPOPA|nr:ABC transporter permease [Sporosarcina pasteurii]MDS9472675.1 ABC transporter permease [Sporosarcina pasteurii]SUJ15880.1 Predicted ABC-type exoprotein transport system, permease component [Sporosarcina pasteurii]